MTTKTVGRYSILREIGRGGMASVFLARQLDLDRFVALKELRAFRDFDPSLARRFLREAQVVGSLNHPNIVTVHEYFEHEGAPYIAMEFLPSGSLRGYVGRLTLAQVGGVLEGLLAGLGHAERHQVVHRDIKPENVLVSAEGGVKIADFGIAKATSLIGQQTQLTALGSTVGTPSYVAPEQAMAAQLGPWTDLYSVGITTFELLVGRTPFGDSGEPMAIVLRQINEPAPRVSDLVPGIDPWIADWVAWLLTKDPAARPQSASEAWNALEEALIRLLGPRWRHEARLLEQATTAATLLRSGAAGFADPDFATTVPPRAPAAPQPARRRRRALPIALIAAVAGLVLALLASAYKAGQKDGPPPSAAARHAQPATPRPAAPLTHATKAKPAPSTNSATRPRAAAPLAAEQAEATRLARSYEQAAAQASATGPEAALRAALVRTARSYRTAATAAAKGDVAAYTAAISAAGTGRQAVSTALAALQSSPAKPPSAPTTPSPAPSASECAGDSTSDDPSDDSCGGA